MYVHIIKDLLLFIVENASKIYVHTTYIQVRNIYTKYKLYFLKSTPVRKHLLSVYVRESAKNRAIKVEGGGGRGIIFILRLPLPVTEAGTLFSGSTLDNLDMCS